MHDVAVERGEILVAFHQAEQIGAHLHQFAGAAGRAVEPADQFLPPRLGGEMQIAGVIVAIGLARQVSIAWESLSRSGPKSRASVFEEGKPAGGVEIVVAVEHLARHGGAGGFAAAGQQRLAQFDQFGGVLLGVGRIRPAAAACGRARKWWTSRSEKKALAMGQVESE